MNNKLERRVMWPVENSDLLCTESLDLETTVWQTVTGKKQSWSGGANSWQNLWYKQCYNFLLLWSLQNLSRCKEWSVDINNFFSQIAIQLSYYNCSWSKSLVISILSFLLYWLLYSCTNITNFQYWIIIKHLNGKVSCCIWLFIFRDFLTTLAWLFFHLNSINSFYSYKETAQTKIFSYVY